MKWSNLVENLESNIEKYGDKDVKFCEVITEFDEDLYGLNIKDGESTTIAERMGIDIIFGELLKIIQTVHDLRDDGKSWRENDYCKYYSRVIYRKIIKIINSENN